MIVVPVNVVLFLPHSNSAPTCIMALPLSVRKEERPTSDATNIKTSLRYAIRASAESYDLAHGCDCSATCHNRS